MCYSPGKVIVTWELGGSIFSWLVDPSIEEKSQVAVFRWPEYFSYVACSSSDDEGVYIWDVAEEKAYFLLVILSEHTWFQLILRILLRALWCKVLSFQSQPHRSTLRGPAIYIWYFTLVSISLQSKKCFAMPIREQDFFILASISASSFSRGVMMHPKYVHFWTKCILFEFRNSRSSGVFSSLSSCFTCLIQSKQSV